MGRDLGCSKLGENRWQLSAEANATSPHPVGADSDDVGRFLVDEPIEDQGARRGRDELDSSLSVDLLQLELFDHSYRPRSPPDGERRQPLGLSVVREGVEK